MSATPRLAVVVVAARGGDRLARTLAAAAWAGELAVLVFGGPADPVAAAVRLLRDPTEIGELAAPWVLLLGEGDTVDERSRRVLADAVAGPPADERLRVRIVTTALGMPGGLAATAVRVAPRGAPLARDERGFAFARSGARIRTVDVEIRRSWGDTLTDAVGVLDAEATVLAALVEPVGRSRRVVGRSGMALARALAARRVDAGPGLGRWILAVLEAYRVIVVYAKLWERRRNRAVVLA
jgi:hypothetical protein